MSGSCDDVPALIAHACPDRPAERDRDSRSHHHRYAATQQLAARSLFGNRTQRDVDDGSRGVELDPGLGPFGLFPVRPHADELQGAGRQRPRELLGRADVGSVVDGTRLAQYGAASGSCRNPASRIDSDPDRKPQFDVASQPHHDPTQHFDGDSGQGPDQLPAQRHELRPDRGSGGRGPLHDADQDVEHDGTEPAHRDPNPVAERRRHQRPDDGTGWRAERHHVRRPDAGSDRGADFEPDRRLADDPADQPVRDRDRGADTRAGARSDHDPTLELGRRAIAGPGSRRPDGRAATEAREHRGS